MSPARFNSAVQQLELQEVFQNEGTAPQLGIVEAAKKFDSAKAPLDLLDFDAMCQIAEVFGFGAKKYGKFNYKKGMDWSRVIAAAYRHLGAFNSGENLDSESGKSHLAHLGCCVFMLLFYSKNHLGKDDRYSPSSDTTNEDAASDKVLQYKKV